MASPDQPAPTPGGDDATLVTLPLKWRADAFAVALPRAATLADVKAAVAARTGAPAAAVKLVGVKAASGGMATDATLLGDVVPPRPGTHFMCLGTPAAAAAALAAAAAAAPALPDDDDDDDGAAPADDDVDPRACPDAQEKLARRIRAFTLVLRRPPRPGKRLLVLDIDYTLFDLGGTGERAADLARPHLHSFLAATHQHYDIVIWSATSMKWVDVKMRELGCSDSPSFSFLAHMDSRAMVTVRTRAHGVFNAKPLPLLWAKLAEADASLPPYGPHNTVMLDDLRRNYVFNPEAGLVIKPYKRSATARATDDELARLTDYLCAIARLDSFTGLNHDKWSKWMRRQGAEHVAAARAERAAAERAAVEEGAAAAEGGGAGPPAAGGGGAGPPAAPGQAPP